MLFIKDDSKMKPMVSVIITCFNYGHYLAGAIESVIKQTYQNMEIIVVDDGSRDNTKQVVKLYPVQYIFQKNQGVAIAKNNGIKQSKGEFFICLDADDKLAPKYVEKTMTKMLENQKIGFVCTGSKVWNEETEVEDLWIPHRIYSKYGLLIGWEGVLGSVLIRHIAFCDLDYGFDHSLPLYEDLDLCFRLLLKGWKIGVVLEPIVWYRLHRNSRNSAKDEIKQYVESLMCERYWLLGPYKKLYPLYQSTIGRVTALVMRPMEYLKGIQKKTNVNVWIKSHHWTNQTNQEKALNYLYEISVTVDKQVKWSWNRKLRDYYAKRLKILESRLYETISTDSLAVEDDING